jgi:hypothetical protein
MKILIIGGGFYGFHLAKMLIEKSKNIEIDIFEKESSIFSGAFTNNQHRLHLGYHYPRSHETIRQSVDNYFKFSNIYKEFIKIPEYNIYSIHKDSLVKFEDYIEIYKNFGLKFDIIDNYKLKLLSNNKLNVSEIISSIKTYEATVDYDRISKYLFDFVKNNINIFTNNEIIKKPSGYDFIINATYNNPNLFLSKPKKIKHEMCAILLAKDVVPQNIGVTIMDGPYCSIFPHHNNCHSISSVLETPFLKLAESENKYSKDEIKNIFKNNNVEDKILMDLRKFIKIDNHQIQNTLLSIKTKFEEDLGDTREASFIREGNYYSIYCGKISAICSIAEEIINEITS